MIASPRKILSSLANNAVGDRIRTLLGYNPPLSLRPWYRQSSISDLFVWRADDIWQTRFEILNIPSMGFPSNPEDDRVVMIFFDAAGQEFARIDELIPPYRRKRLDISEICRGHGILGTFGCFHGASTLRSFADAGVYLSDRGYVGYKHVSHTVWNYVHGNLQAMAKSENHPVSLIGGWGWRPEVYRPQLTFDDCKSFELAFTNPTPMTQSVEVRYLDRYRSIIGRDKKRLPPRGVCLFEYDNEHKNCSMVENSGRVTMWRPVVFKNYESHFDVLHS